LLVRGGGSAEDLDCFNDESVARAIFGSRIPVVSGIGHEIDTTIADFVADSRAPTPSAAAEMVTPDVSDLHASVANLRGGVEHYFAETLNEHRTALRDLMHRLQLQAPSRQVEVLRQRTDELVDRSGRAIVHVLSGQRQQMSTLADRLNALNPSSVLERGYSYCWNEATGRLVSRADQVSVGDDLAVRFSAGEVKARAQKVIVTK
jgi:exodeoxyribonuclease VII large subunit